MRPRPRWLPRAFAAALALLAAAAAAPLQAGCGTDAIGVDACRSIEAARCRRASSCGVDLSQPVAGRGDDVESCVRFYKDACLHGLASKNDPGRPGVDACIAAINAGTCDVVLHPEVDPACAFLVPAPAADAAPAPTPDASDAGGG